MATRAQGYQYDVYLSYRRSPLLAPWVREVKARLAPHLTDDSGRGLQVYFDESDDESQEHWQADASAALRLSRCMVGIWSPPYFRSRWCMSEWETFRARERRYTSAQCRLVAPIQFHDGVHFPPEAHAVGMLDARPYASLSSAFWKTESAIEFERRLAKFAKEVAILAKNAPSFDPDWPVVGPDEVRLVRAASPVRLPRL